MIALLDQPIRLFSAGGWVMYPLLLLSVVSVGLCIERAMFWIAAHRRRRPAWVSKLSAMLRAGDFAEARRFAQRDRSIYGRFASRLLEEPVTDARALEVAENLRPRIERFSGTLSTIITAAPMLGILGTVVGIIHSFRLLGGAGQAVVDPGEVAGGIAQALFTTAFGLVIAIVTLFPYVVFRAAADRCFVAMEAITAAAIEGQGRINNGEKPGDRSSQHPREHRAETVSAGKPG